MKSIGASGKHAVCRAAVASLLIAAAPVSAFAAKDYSDEDFGNRLASAFVRFTEVTVAGGNTSANRLSSAVNPAATDWTPIPSDHRLAIAPYYSSIGFGQGIDLHLAGESFTWQTGAPGAFQPTLSQIRSNKATTALGPEFDYNVDIFQLQWGKRLGNVGVGVAANVNKARVANEIKPALISHSRAESYRFRAGALYEIADKLLAGLVLEHGFAPFRSRTTMFVPRVGFVMTKTTGVQRQEIVRPGLSYEYSPYSVVYVDYQYGRFHNRTGSLESHWFSSGVDQRLFDWLFVRGGVSADARGNVGVTCGLGAHLARCFSLDVGYHYNNLAEVRPEFGRNHTLQVAAGVRF